MLNLFWLGWFNYDQTTFWIQLPAPPHLSAPIWIHEKQLLMNFLPHRRHLTPTLVRHILDKLDLLTIQIQRVFEFKWIIYPLRLLALSILCATYHTWERVSHKISPCTREATPPLFSRIEWIGMSWLAFEFKFDLNSNEQPLIFILSHGKKCCKDAVLHHFKKEIR